MSICFSDREVYLKSISEQELLGKVRKVHPGPDLMAEIVGQGHIYFTYFFVLFCFKFNLARLSAVTKLIIQFQHFMNKKMSQCVDH